MQYVPHMAVLALLVSFFKNGYLIENNVQMKAFRIMEELLDLKEKFAELQKDIANVRSCLNELTTPNANEMCGPSLSNDEVLKKLNMILKGLAKEKDTRINFVKANEAMGDTFRQNLSYLATKIENVSTNEWKIQVIMSKLNKALEDLEEHEKWHRDQEAVQCEDGWRQFNTSCYTVIQIKMSWFDAEQYCQLFGSHLIRIDDDTEFQFIKGVLYELPILKGGNHDTLYWTAGNDIMKEGHYVWTPLNVPIKYVAWYGMEPNNNGGQEHCVEIAYHRGFSMNDHYCKHNFFFICEIDRKNG